MNAQERTASTVALLFVLGVVLFGSFLIFIPGFGAAVDRLSGADIGRDVQTTVTKTISEETGSVAKRTSTEVSETRTTPDTSVFGRALGFPGVSTLFRIGLVLLVAFIAGAFVQRVLVGNYAIEFPFMKIPPLVKADDLAAAMADFRKHGPPPDGDGGGGGGPFALSASADRAFSAVDDPKVAIIGLRFEIERRLRMLSALSGAEPGRLDEMLSHLVAASQLSEPAAAALRKLIELADAAVGARVEHAVLDVVRESGPDVLRRLDSLLSAFVPETTPRARARGAGPDLDIEQFLDRGTDEDEGSASR